MKIVIIGAGNVATHLADALKKANLVVAQIWSHHYENAVALAEKVAAVAVREMTAIDCHSDICFIAVKDDAIADVLVQLDNFTGLIVHTSGAVPLAIFEEKFKEYGIFYPLQTFSKAKAVDFGNIPICLEANNEHTLTKLRYLADQLSKHVVNVDSKKRRILHLSAVFACNFTNHLYALAEEILKANDLDFAMIRPLIMETADKVQDALPASVQTGPAIRGDEQTIKKHEELLSGHTSWLNIYQTLSESIKKTR